MKEDAVENFGVYTDYEEAGNEVMVGNPEIDWDEVETKISIICRKFDNIPERLRDDLKQELRLYAYYKSDDYYHMQNRAVDFWRSLNRHIYPEVPFLDMELMNDEIFEDETKVEYDEIVNKITTELNVPGENVHEDRLNEVSKKILGVILDDIDERRKTNPLNEEYRSTKYINGRISLTYLSEVFPDIHYKRLQKGLKNLESILEGLGAMDKVHIGGFIKTTTL